MKIASSIRKTTDLQLIEGTKKHLGKGWALYFAGKKFTASELADLLQRRVNAVYATTVAKAAWLAARGNEAELLDGTEAVVAAARQNLIAMFSGSQDALVDFGLTPRKERKALTAVEMVQKADKARATRAARHTMGSRQKEAIKGNDATHVEPPIAPPPAAPAAAHPVNGAPVPSMGGT
jgi:hypothetical protein